jgi:hypothetical protein
MSTGRVDTYVVGEVKVNDGFILTVKRNRKYYPIVWDDKDGKFVVFESAWAWLSGYTKDTTFDIARYKFYTFMSTDTNNCIYTPEGKGYLYVTNADSGELVLHDTCGDEEVVLSTTVTIYPIHAESGGISCKNFTGYVFRMVEITGGDGDVLKDYPYTLDEPSSAKNHLVGTQVVLYDCKTPAVRNLSFGYSASKSTINKNDDIYGGLGIGTTIATTIKTSLKGFNTMTMFPTKWVTTENCTRDWSVDKTEILTHFCSQNLSSRDKWFSRACKDTYKGYTSSIDPTTNPTYQVGNGILYKYGTTCAKNTLRLANMVDNKSLQDATSETVTWAPTDPASDGDNIYCSYNTTNRTFQKSTNMFREPLTCTSTGGGGDGDDGGDKDSYKVWIIVIIVVSVIIVMILVVLIFAGTHYLKKGTADPEDISSTNGGAAGM